MFRALKKLFSRPSITDPVFGELRYQGDNTWQESKPRTFKFPPTHQRLELTLDAPESGPSEKHHRFFEELCSHYEAVSQSALKIILEESSKSKEAFPEAQSWEAFQLYGLKLPNPVERPVQWQIAYFCEKAGHWFDVEFEDWSPVSVTVNG